MIEFHISETLVKDLEMHLRPPRPATAYGLQFYAHRVTVARRKCMIVMELQSRYAFVFCGMTKKEFEQFPELFQERLWREVLSICELENEDDMAFMSDLVLGLSSEQYFQPGTNHGVEMHVSQVADQLVWMVNNGIYKLPVLGSDAFAFGLDVNEVPRTVDGGQSYFQPYLVFKEFWRGMLAFARKEKKGRSVDVPFEPPETWSSTLAARMDKSFGLAEDNVIKVDFVNRKRK